MKSQILKRKLQINNLNIGHFKTEKKLVKILVVYELNAFKLRFLWGISININIFKFLNGNIG